MLRGDDAVVLRHVGDEPHDDVAAFNQPQRLCDLLVQSRKVQRKTCLVVLRVRRRKQPLVDRPCRVSEGSLPFPRTGRVPQRLPDRLLELRVDVTCPSSRKWMSATAGLRLIRKARAEDATQRPLRAMFAAVAAHDCATAADGGHVTL